MKAIKSYSFLNCNELRVVRLPESLKQVYNSAFLGCENISDVYFAGTKAQWDSIFFGGDHGSILEATLHLTNDYDLSSENHFNEESDPVSGCTWKCGAKMWAVLYENGTLYLCGDGKMYDFSYDEASGENDIPWSEAADKIKRVVAEDGVSYIGSNAFRDLPNLSSVLFSKSVKTIGESSFKSSAVEDVFLPAVQEIGESAFADCAGLSYLSALHLVTINKSAFADCTSLYSADLPATVEKIGERAFSGCTGITDVYYPMAKAYWDSINIENGNDSLLLANIHFEMTLDDSVYGHSSQTSPPVESGIVSWSNSWELYEDGTLYVYGRSGSCAIPDYIPDNGSYAPWYDFRDKIKKVVIESGMTKLGRNAFYGLENVVDICIGSDIDTLSVSCFEGCKALKYIDLPSKITMIPETAFEGCSSLEQVTAYGATNVQNEAFMSCSSLESVSFSPKLSFFGNRVFSGCESLEELYISETLASVGVDCFLDTPWYDSFKDEFSIIGSGILLKYNGFRSSDSYEEIVCIPNGVKSIAPKAFDGFAGIEAIQIPASVKSFMSESFSINELDSIYYLDSKTQWDKISFSAGNDIVKNCPNIYYNTYYSKEGASNHTTEVTKLVEKGNCGDELEWEFYASGRLYIYGTGDMYDYSLTFNTLKLPPWYDKYSNAEKSITEIIIEPGAESIGDLAFAQCSKCTRVTIPDTVSRIGLGAFEYCSLLQDVELPAHDIQLGDKLFWGCRALEYADLSHITSYGKHMFEDCESLREIELNPILHFILDYLFTRSGISTFTIPSNITKIGEGAFSGCNSLNRITIPSNVTEIGDSAFRNSQHLDADLSSEGATLTIGKYAFASTAVKSISIKRDMNIGSSAFLSCDLLKNLSINRGSIYLDNDAFCSCEKLSNVTLSEEAKYSFGNTPFKSCGDIKTITIPASMKTVPSGVFSNLGLNSVTLTNGITGIDDRAFQSCMMLSNVTIPDSVTSIGKYAFNNCTSLTDVYFFGTKNEWESIAIDYTYTYTELYYPPQYYDKGGPVKRERTETTNTYLANAKKHYQSGIPNVIITLGAASGASPQVMISQLRPNTQYVLFLIGDSLKELTASDNLVFVDQQTSNDSGEITLNDSFSDPVKLVAVGQKPDASDPEPETDTDKPTDTEKTIDTDSHSDTDKSTDIYIDPNIDTDTSEDPNTDIDKPIDPSDGELYGDVDKDGAITANDALMILRQSIGMENFDAELIKLGDTDEDGYITANDALAVLRYSIGMQDGSNVDKPVSG